MNLRRRMKPEQPEKPAENARPPESEPLSPRDPRSFAEFRRKFPGGKVPQIVPQPPGLAELQLREAAARRRAEEQAERARIKAELAAEKARKEAESDAWLEDFIQNGLRDAFGPPPRSRRITAQPSWLRDGSRAAARPAQGFLTGGRRRAG